MTQHLHHEFVEGCFRCDLSRDEAENPCWLCDTCEDMGEVAVNFGIHSTGTPSIEPCPDCGDIT